MRGEPMPFDLNEAASALWWAGRFSTLAAARGDARLNALARRFQAEFERQRIADMREWLSQTDPGALKPRRDAAP